MLQYLVILLDDAAISYCHYSKSHAKSQPIPLDVLRKGIRFAMTENLMLQFVYPEGELPESVRKEVETIDHSKIMPATSPYAAEADVLVCGWDSLPQSANVPVVLRTTLADFLARYKDIFPLLSVAPRLNVVFTDTESFADEEVSVYKESLSALAGELERLYVNEKSPQLNLLTDRMMLKEMNNCGAGDTNITLAPNGKFYVCPAYCGTGEGIGSLELGLSIPNKQLYKLDHAPLCRHCDAYHCKRCVWLSERLTLEVNTPSRQQCVMAHLERNAARELLSNIRKHGIFLPEMPEIKEIDYLDPFEKRDEWL
ncbi:MAG: CXXX repeat peptide maturase [Bacteroidaceae bacterium]|nr:CXXX repeat peptide maturase [Bacteroidaceae bacterium]